MRDLLKFLILPPVSLYLGMMVGAVLVWRRQRAGWPVLVSFFGLLVLLSLPVVSAGLMRTAQSGIEPFDPDAALSVASSEAAGPQAIVILSAGLEASAPERGGKPQVDTMTMARLAHGAWLWQKTELPVLVTGGPWGPDKIILAPLMAEHLRDSFQIETRWVEARAGNTAGNAAYSADLLIPEGRTRILLVTHAWHMRRAVSAFERQGFEVTPAPMGFEGLGPLTLGSFAPSASALHESYYGMHELVGRVWYWVVS